MNTTETTHAVGATNPRFAPLAKNIRQELPPSISDSLVPIQDGYPNLASLGLSPEEMNALKRQGFVARERRSARHTRFTLRFRFHGRQQRKYIGTNSEAAHAVGREVAQLQQQRRNERALRVLRRETAKSLKECKQRLGPLIDAIGLRFHGFSVRRTKRTISKER